MTDNDLITWLDNNCFQASAQAVRELNIPRLLENYNHARHLHTSTIEQYRNYIDDFIIKHKRRQKLKLYDQN
jgi:hypothetical protein